MASIIFSSYVQENRTTIAQRKQEKNDFIRHNNPDVMIIAKGNIIEGIEAKE